MNDVKTPERWAFDITLILNKTLGQDHFPIDVPLVAREYSRHRFPEAPLTAVVGDNLPGFEGALYPAPDGKQGWGIFYNRNIVSPGRINFTLAHEFGHYLIHRTRYPRGIQCSDQDVIRWDSEYGQIEHQANVFAANLLMPLDDFRRQIPGRSRIDLEIIGLCAERYNVSLIAAILRWLQYTLRRAVLVVSRDGYILWARSSEPALVSGAFFRTSAGPIEIPEKSLAAQSGRLGERRASDDLPADVWFREPCHETVVMSDRFDLTISLLQLGGEPASSLFHGNEPAEDAVRS